MTYSITLILNFLQMFVNWFDSLVVITGVSLLDVMIATGVIVITSKYVLKDVLIWSSENIMGWNGTADEKN